jgi:hypothetical protein
MRSRRWLYARAAALFALASSEDFALGKKTATVATNMAITMTTTGAVMFTTITTAMLCGPGMTTITTTSRPASPSGISCRPVWRNNSWCAAHSHRACGRKFNVARKTWNGGYRLRRQIANTSSSAVTSSC